MTILLTSWKSHANSLWSLAVQFIRSMLSRNAISMPSLTLALVLMRALRWIFRLARPAQWYDARQLTICKISKGFTNNTIKQADIVPAHFANAARLLGKFSFFEYKTDKEISPYRRKRVLNIHITTRGVVIEERRPLNTLFAHVASLKVSGVRKGRKLKEKHCGPARVLYNMIPLDKIRISTVTTSGPGTYSRRRN